ncbi:DUF4276 family protein [Streptomyces sp. NBC_01498]|uniref:DUF4276 family protein n=1 Tax=Streptomyces sp. NBC_01498 TaxID=2975870 RepID=UPI002E7B4DB0|nr:DUF4276 family protein [Streptomyces sp. NBC_01498]WTL26422.1 DUF4276 family protein [Streptomyces sp. NBC_01498]
MTRKVVLRRRVPQPVISLELLVEEESADEALKPVLARIFTDDTVRVKVRRFQGKHDLLKKLPDRLNGYAAARRRGEDIRVVVLVDQDNDDCTDLKRKLDSMAAQAGLTTRAKRPGTAGAFHVLNRIAIRELESWYFGDWPAVQAAFPKVTQDVPRNYKHNPDSVSGKCSDAFEKILRAHGIRMPSKPEWGRRIGPKLSLTDNRSPSFHAFVSGVRDVAAPVSSPGSGSGKKKKG